MTPGSMGNVVTIGKLIANVCNCAGKHEIQILNQPY